MSDPALEAAQRTSAAYCRGEIPAEPGCNTHTPGVDEIGEFAAREALRPIQTWFEWWHNYSDHGELPGYAWGELAKLIYATGELANDGTNRGTNCDGKMCADGCLHHG